MVTAHDLHLVAPGLFLWHAYDRNAKAELFSSAFDATNGRYLVDPIPLLDHSLNALSAGSSVAGVIVTNANHDRASGEFALRFGVKIHRRDHASGPPDKIDNDIEVVAIDGAAPGEIALCVRETLFIGDALINFAPYGFAFLPAKYCTNPKAMPRSLGQLLDLNFSRILFAHGEPITTKARERLQRLLSQSR